MKYRHSILCEVLKYSTEAVEVSTSFLLPPHTPQILSYTCFCWREANTGDQVFPQTICGLLFCPVISYLNAT